MVYAYALMCLIANPMSCTALDGGTHEAVSCRTEAVAVATAWLPTHSTYVLSRVACMNGPLTLDSVQAITGP